MRAQNKVWRRCALAAAFLAASLRGSSAQPKHIVFLMIDDLGYNDVRRARAHMCVCSLHFESGVYTALIAAQDSRWSAQVSYRNTSDLSSPNIDKLAMDGLRLERYYTHNLCSPSRTSFLRSDLPIDGHTFVQALNCEAVTNHSFPLRV